MFNIVNLGLKFNCFLPVAEKSDLHKCIIIIIVVVVIYSGFAPSTGPDINMGPDNMMIFKNLAKYEIADPCQ